jgi:transcription initiation factor IIF auxiliary subunit
VKLIKELVMFKCKVCAKGFADWHALGGHMRTHRGVKEENVSLSTNEEQKKERLSQALAKLSELSPQEAWQIVVNWIMDVYRQTQLRDEIIQAYRLRVEDSESRIESVQSELRRLRQLVVDGYIYKAPDDQL